MEEARNLENAKLQTSLDEMHLQFKETKELLIKEWEISKKALEVTPVIKEIPVIDNAIVEQLTIENERLKVGGIFLSFWFP